MQKIFGKISNLVAQEQQKTFLIVGLGNPGREYKNNRHNVGFMVADAIAKKIGGKFSRMQSNALITKGVYADARIILAKPYSFMNASGQPVISLVRFYKIPFEFLLVIFDDVDLSFGTIRMRSEGRSSGQQGMKSIIKQLRSQEFNRLRIGIGRPPGKMKTPDYVLQDFKKEECEDLPMILDRASEAALSFTAKGVAATMNIYNQSP
jgi:PTH1 family peptidyl-tRNA hydrolase